MTGLSWWLWWRARRRLQDWVRAVIAARPYRIEYRTGAGSFVDFSQALLVVEPDMPARWRVGQALPTTWGATRITRLTQLQVLCSRALAYHEAGHVLFTQPGVTAGGLHHTVTNILEDERMERLVARYYPPAASDLSELGRRLWLEGCVPSADRATRLLNAALYHRWDADRPASAASRLVLSDPGERRAWEEDMRPLVEQAWEAPDTARVAVIALRILALIGVPPTSAPASFPGLLAGAGAPPRGQRDQGDAPLPPQTRGWGAASAHVGGAGDGGPTGAGHDPDAEGALATETADVDPSGGVLWAQPYEDLERSVAPETRRLQDELKAPAPRAEPEANRYRGRFDAHALVRSRGARPLVRAVREGPSPEGLAVLLVIDGTGSNGGHPGSVTADNRPAHPAAFHHPLERMPHVRRAAMLLQRACAGLGIPCAIAEACGDWRRVHAPHLPCAVANPVTWVQRWDTDPQAEGPRALIAGLYGHGGSEEVCRSLEVCATAFASRPEGVKLLIYLHDGQPNDPVAAIRATLARLRGQGLTVIGLYIGPQTEVERMEAIFDREWTIAIATLPELPARLARLLARFRAAR